MRFKKLQFTPIAWKVAVIFLPLVFFARGLSFSAHLPIWSPRDEIAHYDYIDQLDDLKLPDPQEPI